MQTKILVVEDDPDIMQIIVHALRSAGFEPIQAYGGKDALRKLTLHKIELVLTDLAMPEMNGAELIDNIRSNPETAGTPIIAVTAHIWGNIAQAAGQLGCDGFISKPFTAKHLIEEVDKHLNRAS